MAPKVFSDRVDMLEATMRFGVVVRLVRRLRVVHLTKNNFEILVEALSVSGVPANGSTLAGAPNLVCTERNPRLAESDKKTVDIDVVYEHAFNEGQSLSTPLGGAILGESQTTINQVSSNVDVDGNPITLSHTYPSEDPDYPNLLKTQGGEVQTAEPQTTHRFQAIKQVLFPSITRDAISGAINSVSWNGGSPGTWLCTGCSYRPCDMSAPSSWFFSFEFQFNPDGWDPTVVFKDDRTNKPPPNLIETIGYKTVAKYRRINFEGAIGARVQGG